MDDELPPLPWWGTAAKWIVAAGVLAVVVSRIVDDDPYGAGSSFREVTVGVATAAFAVWGLSCVVWIVRRRRDT